MPMNEGTMSMLAAVLCGANFILHSAGFLDGLLSMSYEKFVMDVDFCAARFHLSRWGEGGRQLTGACGCVQGGRAGQP